MENTDSPRKLLGGIIMAEYPPVQPGQRWIATDEGNHVLINGYDNPLSGASINDGRSSMSRGATTFNYNGSTYRRTADTQSYQLGANNLTSPVYEYYYDNPGSKKHGWNKVANVSLNNQLFRDRLNSLSGDGNMLPPSRSVGDNAKAFEAFSANDVNNQVEALLGASQRPARRSNESLSAEKTQIEDHIRDAQRMQTELEAARGNVLHGRQEGNAQNINVEQRAYEEYILAAQSQIGRINAAFSGRGTAQLPILAQLLEYGIRR